MFSKELQIKHIYSRIALLSARGQQNGRIIAKLQRQLRALQK